MMLCWKRSFSAVRLGAAGLVVALVSIPLRAQEQHTGYDVL